MARLDQIVGRESPPLFWLHGFDGVNLHDDRRVIGDQECSWLENLVPLGAGNARALYDSVLIYTAAKTIVYDFSFNIGSTFYHFLVYSDGSAEQVDMNGMATSIGGASTFAVSPTLPYAVQWGSSGIVIVTADTNGYFAWDGALSSPGGASPAWLSGLSAPLTPTGNTNTSTSLTGVSSTVGIVTGMWITGTDIPANTYVVSTTVNTITISQAATGSHNGITFTVQWQMPLGIKGTAAEIFLSRVWVLNGNKFSWTAPSNGADFSTADGGGSTTSSDSFLRTAFVNAKQSNGFLYLLGDGSINVISNVQTSGSPLTTTFNNQNVDPQTGLGWRDAIAPFGRALCFANPSGVYALFGGAATKISDKIDKLFEKANFSALTPTMFATTIFGVVFVGITLNTLDPTTNTQRNIVALWNGSKWFIASQQFIVKFGVTLEQNGHPVAHANNDTKVFNLFAVASSTLQKKAQSKLWPGKSPLIKKTTQDVYAESVDIAGAGVILNGTLDSDTNAAVSFALTSNINFVNSQSQLITFTNSPNGDPLQFVSSPPGVQGTQANQAGTRLGITLTSTSSDFALLGMGETYNEQTFIGR